MWTFISCSYQKPTQSIVLCRGIVVGKSSLSSSNSYDAKEKFSEEAIITRSKSLSPDSVESSDDGMIFILIFLREDYDF